MRHGREAKNVQLLCYRRDTKGDVRNEIFTDTVVAKFFNFHSACETVIPSFDFQSPVSPVQTIPLNEINIVNSSNL